MSKCVECPEYGDNDALADDYLCQAHRDVLEGARYCKDCGKRWVPEYGSKAVLCPICGDKQQCEYCGKLYSEKRILAASRRHVGDTVVNNGVRFKGLCEDCKVLAEGSIPNTPEGHMQVKCPDCYHIWDVDLDRPLEFVY